MPKTFDDPAVRAEIVRRLQALTPESRPRWGGLTVGKMVCHLGDLFEALYDPPERKYDGKPITRSFPVKHLFLYVLPFPHGVKGPRGVFRTEPAADFARDVDRARRLAIEYPDRAGKGAHGWPGHPYFGPLDGKEWGYFTYKHADHHLRQFGV